jgi:hypothetical protein
MTEEQRKQCVEVLNSWCCSSEGTKMVRSRRIKSPKCVERILEKYVHGSRKSLGEETSCENQMHMGRHVSKKSVW